MAAASRTNESGDQGHQEVAEVPVGDPLVVATATLPASGR